MLTTRSMLTTQPIVAIVRDGDAWWQLLGEGWEGVNAAAKDAGLNPVGAENCAEWGTQPRWEADNTDPIRPLWRSLDADEAEEMIAGLRKNRAFLASAGQGGLSHEAI